MILEKLIILVGGMALFRVLVLVMVLVFGMLIFVMVLVFGMLIFVMMLVFVMMFLTSMLFTTVPMAVVIMTRRLAFQLDVGINRKATFCSVAKL